MIGGIIMVEVNKIPIYFVDAFTDEKFKGNPAAVCLLKQKLDDKIMQNIAAEMNLSETAFLVPLDDKPIADSHKFSLRWFTPKVEVPLCGHATLASAAVLFFGVGTSVNEVRFQTLSGDLIAKREGYGIILDFPLNEPKPIDPPEELLKSSGILDYENVAFSKEAKKLLVHLKDEKHVMELKPDYEKMKDSNPDEDMIGVIATSLGSPPFDFVSRFFAPWVGVNEDPVTGSAHTVLTPYWSKILGKNEMTAYQASERGGKLIVRKKEDRVELIGNAVIVLRGELSL
ncbi:MAG: PhzF family phenazine biosynthesis protein [Thermoplasmata archaeon]|nr:MAG: PhzF family phenazine biosynthesis protein [Thermoplasmata archaeon]